jgi:hypothetical protein
MFATINIAPRAGGEDRITPKNKIPHTATKEERSGERRRRRRRRRKWRENLN